MTYNMDIILNTGLIYISYDIHNDYTQSED